MSTSPQPKANICLRGENNPADRTRARAQPVRGLESLGPVQYGHAGQSVMGPSFLRAQITADLLVNIPLLIFM